MGKNLKGKELGKNLYQRKDGRYEAKAMINGVKINLYDFNLAKLKKRLQEAKNKADNNLVNQFSGKLLNDWFFEWFTTYKKPYVKESSVNTLIDSYKNYFGRYIGDMKIQKIANYHIQNAVTSLMNEKRSKSSIKTAYSLLKNCMESAKNNKIIDINPCFDIKISSQNDIVNRRFLTVDEQNLFMEHVENNWYKEMFYIMFHTGLRISEVGGLTWDDVDFKEKCFHINKSLLSYYDNGVKIQKFYTLKSKNSYRDIPFFNKVEEMLLSQKHKQQILKARMEENYRSNGEFSDVVFCTKCGSVVSRYVVTKAIKRVVEEINLEENVNSVMENREPNEFERIHPHSFRHTFCSRCFEKGISPKVVQSLMGHSSYATTIDTYTHITKDKMSEELKKFKD